MGGLAVDIEVYEARHIVVHLVRLGNVERRRVVSLPRCCPRPAPLPRPCCPPSPRPAKVMATMSVDCFSSGAVFRFVLLFLRAWVGTAIAGKEPRASSSAAANSLAN